MKQPSARLMRRFRNIGIIEGISFLLLLCIAMPLKYFAGIPEAVKYTGWAHGVLFVAYIYLAFEVMGNYNKSFGWLIKAFIAAILPFGTFILDKQLRREEAATTAHL